MDLIAERNDITSSEMAQILSKDISTIKRAIQKLKDKGLLSRIGSDKEKSVSEFGHKSLYLIHFCRLKY